MPDVVSQLKTGLADRYTLERELGQGGMATVFLARDLRHDRQVALKVLRPELADALGAERFLAEIKLCARLQHPHILTVLDSGETAGHLWFTMPYVEGESLRDRLTREKQLSVPEAVRITREAALALDYAHRHGVVHRDVKPENILLSDGQALVADFGIGRALTPGQDRLTATGLSLGTPAYMSPEQAAGERDVDARSDVYSLATVLYEMLAGGTPFAGPTSQATMSRRFTETAKPLRTLRESVPVEIERAVLRALARTAADRFASAAEFAQALESGTTVTAGAGTLPSAVDVRKARRPSPALMTLALGFLIGIGALFAWRFSSGKRTPAAGGQLIAVLPFENVGDAADEYFADGITDEVRGKLSALPGLRVIASGSSKTYKKTTKPLADIGRELGVDYLLVAQVRWAKAADGTSRVRVSPELVQLSDGTPTTRWSQPFDASLTDVFQVQADIASKVATQLDIALGDSARRTLAAAPTSNLAAYDAFLKGDAASQGLSVVDPASLRRAIAFYEQAVSLDSTFAAGWSRLARARSLLYLNSVPLPELARQARDAAERAQALAPGRPAAALALAQYYRSQVDHHRTLATIEEGLRLAPNDAELLGFAGISEQSLGAWEAALEHFSRSRALDPRSTTVARRRAVALLFLRRYAEARAAADSALALAPTNLAIIQVRTMATLGEGDLQGARETLRAKAAAVEPAALVAFVSQYWDLGWMLDEAQQQQLLTLPPVAFDGDRGAWGLVRAQAYYLRGDQARARVYADSALPAFLEQLRGAPNDAQRHVLIGLTLAYHGRKAEAIEEGERGTQLVPVSRDGYNGPYFQHVLARIYTVTGEQGKAIDVLESLLKVPYFISRDWLRIDPNFASLKGNPRFDRLLAAK